MDNILFTVTSKNIIDKLKSKGITKLVYPLSSFCVGIPTCFSIDEIEGDGYLLINRVLDTKAIDDLEVIINNLPSNIKGIIFDDVGLIELLKNKNIEKIFYYSHFNTNYLSINSFFNYVDDIIVSTDITEKEIDEIIANTSKKISAITFGLISSFYSRRHLLNNYSVHYNIPLENPMMLNINDKRFLAYENEYGTVLYHYPYFNGRVLSKKDIHYQLILPYFLEDDEVINVLDDKTGNIEMDDGFLYTPTIYKVK